MLAYSLAARLNKCLSEIMSMPETEFFGWIAYFDITEKGH